MAAPSARRGRLMITLLAIFFSTLSDGFSGAAGPLRRPTRLGARPLEEQFADSSPTWDATVVWNDVEHAISVIPGESLLAAAERAGVWVETECRRGNCVTCASRVLPDSSPRYASAVPPWPRLPAYVEEEATLLLLLYYYVSAAATAATATA